MVTVSSQVCMIRGDNRLIEETGGCQSSRPKYHRINQVNNIGLKLVQATYEEGTKEVKFEFGVERQGESCSTNDLSSSILLNAILRPE